MSAQTTAKPRPKRLTEEQAVALAKRDALAQARAKARAVSTEASEELLDEIDELLEETAYQASFLQKGGE